MTLFHRNYFLLLGTAIAAVIAPHVAGAQTAPTRSVRIIVPCAVGTPPDLAVRILAKQLSMNGQQVYVENFTAGAGPIRMDGLNKLLADDRSILFNLGHCDD